MSDWSWTPPADSGIAVRMQQAGEVALELAELPAADGSTDRLALCVHGFPELNFSWRYQMPLLSQLGWRVWAPNLRGYGASDRPTGVSAYHIDRLIGDLVALIDASGAKEVLLIAHDWGAIIAWQFAIRRARPLVGLVILNVPHPARLRARTEDLGPVAAQLVRLFLSAALVARARLRARSCRRDRPRDPQHGGRQERLPARRARCLPRGRGAPWCAHRDGQLLSLDGAIGQQQTQR